MSRPFHQEIEGLKKRVIEMGTLAGDSLRKGVEAFTKSDLGMADEASKLDQAINRLDVEIETAAIDLIALRQPLGRDLRTLGATLKIITYLDRIGRYGYDVAEATRAIEGKEHPRKMVVIPHMAEKAGEMLREALEAYATGDATKARAVPPKDELVDALYEQILRESITYMVEDPRTIGLCAHYILVARHLERVGDNACKIAEKALYMVTGERRLSL